MPSFPLVLAELSVKTEGALGLFLLAVVLDSVKTEAGLGTPPTRKWYSGSRETSRISLGYYLLSFSGSSKSKWLSE